MQPTYRLMTLQTLPEKRKRRIVADCGGLLTRAPFLGLVGSNPTASAANHLHRLNFPFKPSFLFIPV